MNHFVRNVLLASLLSSAPAFAQTDVTTEQALTDAIAGAWRVPANVERDKYRHPKETLEFFGLKRNMTVVEIWPGSGWYTEILAPVLADKGKYYAAYYPAGTDNAYFNKNLAKYKEKLASNPVYAKVELTEFNPPEKVSIAPAGSADLVLTFRNVHNWMKAGSADAAFKAMYDALKPGGVLGVVEHRLPADRPQSEQAETGYVQVAYVVGLATKAGFQLAGNSDINANPKDAASHPKGVWTLPPTLALGDEDKEKYLAIGESDRMTLKFVKPKK